MISYVTVGSDDIQAARRFYDAFLPSLGYTVSEGAEGIRYALPVAEGTRPVFPDFYVKPTFDGAPAMAGNGTMVAFETTTQAQVQALHVAALTAGGSDEGRPGFRAGYGADFYVCYLRDPQGNKIAVFSCNPDEPTRHD
ncbi:MAG: VOC family protein [Paracoccaceae bacterium]|nr:VOC family protein [Paracoccaceae bacterium]